ncbi:hypothetical protein BC629DRAFT_1493308 [Irpex lacteus]|nr:hypothetical protein BC629DRAFT_1493308 [Irpex lacteus]
MSERSLQQLEKIIHKESDADARNVEMHRKEFNKRRKLFKKPLRYETEKAQKAVEKTAKQEIKTFKALHAAEDKLKGAVAGREKAENKMTQQDIQQRYVQLDEAYTTFDQKETTSRDGSGGKGATGLSANVVN